MWKEVGGVLQEFVATHCWTIEDRLLNDGRPIVLRTGDSVHLQGRWEKCTSIQEALQAGWLLYKNSEEGRKFQERFSKEGFCLNKAPSDSGGISSYHPIRTPSKRNLRGYKEVDTGYVFSTCVEASYAGSAVEEVQENITHELLGQHTKDGWTSFKLWTPESFGTPILQPYGRSKPQYSVGRGEFVNLEAAAYFANPQEPITVVTPTGRRFNFDELMDEVIPSWLDEKDPIFTRREKLYQEYVLDVEGGACEGEGEEEVLGKVYGDGSKDGGSGDPPFSQPIFSRLKKVPKYSGQGVDWEYLQSGLTFTLFSLAVKLSHSDPDDFTGWGLRAISSHVRKLIAETPPKVLGTLHKDLYTLHQYLTPLVYALDLIGGEWNEADALLVKELKYLNALPVFEYYRGWGEVRGEEEGSNTSEGGDAAFGFMGAALLSAVGLSSLLLLGKPPDKISLPRKVCESVPCLEEEEETDARQARSAT